MSRLSLKLLIILFLVGFNFIMVHMWMNNQHNHQKIKNSVTYLESYQSIINDYYQINQQMPPVGYLFAKTANPQANNGYDIPGTYDLYYETLPKKNKAFMAIRMMQEHHYKFIYVAFVIKNNKVETHCGPWQTDNLDYLQINVYPRHCHDEISKIIGVDN